MRLEEISFGYVVVDGKRFDEDIVICGEKIYIRRKDLSASYRALYGHTPLSREELEHYLSICRDFDMVVIGTGIYGALPIMDSARELLDRLGREVVIAKSRESIEVIDKAVQQGKKVLAVIHVTC